MLRPACIALAFALAGCVSTSGSALAPLPAGREVETSYEAELGPAARGPDPNARERREQADIARTDTGPLVRVQCTWRELDERDVERLLGADPSSTIARIANRVELEESLDRWLETGAMQEAQNQTLVLHSGTPGYVSVHDDTAFVGGFGIVQSRGAIIGDPQVSIAREECTFDARALLASASGPIDVEVALHLSALQRPLLESDVELPGTKQSVALEVPIAFRQELKASARLAEGEVLVLGPLVAKNSERRILAFIEASTEQRGGGTDTAGP